MFYDFAVTVLAGTTEATPKVEDLKLTAGIIHPLSVEFPAGCRGYVYCKLYHQEHQVWPTNPQGTLRAEGYTIPIEDYYPLTTEPYSLKVRAWSPLAIYDHTLRVRVTVVTEEELEPLKDLPAEFQKFFKLLGVKS